MPIPPECVPLLSPFQVILALAIMAAPLPLIVSVPRFPGTRRVLLITFYLYHILIIVVCMAMLSLRGAL